MFQDGGSISRVVDLPYLTLHRGRRERVIDGDEGWSMARANVY
jgi:hypothetical protein